MAILKILKYGDEKLRQKTKNVTKFSKKIRTLIEDMFDTMYANAGVGLAASQVGEAYRIFVADVSLEDERPMPLVFVNPKIIKKSGAMNSLEGCLSFPQVNAYVRRYSSVLIRAQDIDGHFFTLETPENSLLSKCVQHEYDHLDGILFVDHARDIEATNKVLTQFEFDEIDCNRIVDEPELEREITLQVEIEAKSAESEE